MSNNSSYGSSGDGDLYEVPDGKPSSQVATPVAPEYWSNNGDRTSCSSRSASLSSDENIKPDVYIEHVLLPTRATKVSST